MSLSHFDERSGIVSCETPWGQWWQTVSEVFIEVDVPHGTRAKNCKIDIKTKHIKCTVDSNVIFEGNLYQNVIVEDCTWTLEEQIKISILLTKTEKFTNKNLWESLVENEYMPDPWMREQMLKKLDLEKFQIENAEEMSSPLQREGDAEERSSSPQQKEDVESSKEDAESSKEEEEDVESSKEEDVESSKEEDVESSKEEEDVESSKEEDVESSKEEEDAESGKEDAAFNKEEDAESNASGSDNEAEEEEDALDEQAEQTEEHGSVASSPPQSPTSSVNQEHSEDEVHISEAEDESNRGSDAEKEDHESDGEMSAAEAEVEEEEEMGIKKDHEEPEEDEEQKVEEEDEEIQDSDREEDEQVPEINIQSEDEDNAERAGSDAEEKAGDDQSDEEKEHDKSVEDEAKSPRGLEHSDEENENDEKAGEGETSRKMDSDAEGSDSEKDEIIADIFGDSDDEQSSPKKGEKVVKKKLKKGRVRRVLSDSDDEKSDGEGADEKANNSEGDQEEKSAQIDQEEEDQQMEVEESSPKKKAIKDDSDEDDDDGKMRSDFISDFELMMKKKKESSTKRKRKDVDIINDSDDLIADIIAQMRIAADEDRQLNKMKKTATKKLRILPHVMSQLKKQDLKMAFLDQGVLNVMADWLAPLPDRSLPNLQIREGMIKRLMEFPFIDQSLLKSSGVGRALMYLYKHPKETKENKERAGKLITKWARPIFNVTTDYHSLTKEEREQRDFYHIPKKRRSRGQAEGDEVPEQKDIDKALREGDRVLRPGDKGWVGRARVPMPSTKDYVVRPKWNVEMEFGRAPMKKPLTRFEKHMRSQQEKKRSSKSLRAVTISIEGRKMAI